MTNDELDRLEALAGAAAPWPWEVDDVWKAVPRLVAEVRRLRDLVDSGEQEARPRFVSRLSSR